MTHPAFRRRSARLAAALAAVSGLAGPLGFAVAQDPVAPDGWDDARPPIAAYVIVDALGVEAPLGGAEGDAERGRVLFADPETGGCVACHAAPGIDRVLVAPRILRDRVDPLPPPVAAAPTASAVPPPPPASDSDSRLAPREALIAAARPTDLTPQEAGPPAEDAAQGAPVDLAEAPQAPAPAPPEPVFRGQDEPDRPRLLPVPVGPDLTGVASRLSPAALRLWVIDPRGFGAGHAMPGYHA
ncbi:MAG: hypothetical protein AAF676_04660, partial [Pseudomonadota bacterium]